MAVADTDQVIFIQRDECLTDGLGRATVEGGDDVLDGNWPAMIKEHPQNPPRHLCLSGGTPSPPPGLQIKSDQLVGGLDDQVRHPRPSVAHVPCTTIESGVTTDSSGIF